MVSTSVGFQCFYSQLIPDSRKIRCSINCPPNRDRGIPAPVTTPTFRPNCPASTQNHAHISLFDQFTFDHIYGTSSWVKRGNLHTRSLIVFLCCCQCQLDVIVIDSSFQNYRKDVSYNSYMCYLDFPFVYASQTPVSCLAQS